MSITANIRLNHNGGSLLAYCDVQVHFAASVLSIYGLRVIQHDSDKPPWVAYPQQAGKKEGRWYDVVKITGQLHEEIFAAVMKAFAKAVKEESSASPRKSGDEDIPF
jgi:DNA-binding cell septation regulator SpoVG